MAQSVTITIRLAGWYTPTLRLILWGLWLLACCGLISPDRAIQMLQSVAMWLAPHALRAVR